MKELKTAVVSTFLFIVLTGLLFPVVVWVFAQLLFNNQANGSFVKLKDGKIVGSELIGQNFTQAKYFHPRPSAAGAGYDTAASGGTNLGPISSKLIIGIKDDPSTEADERFSGVADLSRVYRLENLLSENIKLPADSVTRSGSGLDPHISPANALLQANRIAQVRKVELKQVQKLIQENIQERYLGIWGEPRVNVLKLNLKLDEQFS